MGWKPPQKAKRDANEGAVFEALEAHGLTVEPTDKPLDSVVGFAGRTYLVEVKNGPKAPLTKAQKKFFKEWPGQAEIITSVDEAIDFAKRVRAGEV